MFLSGILSGLVIPFSGALWSIKWPISLTFHLNITSSMTVAVKPSLKGSFQGRLVGDVEMEREWDRYLTRCWNQITGNSASLKGTCSFQGCFQLVVIWFQRLRRSILWDMHFRDAITLDAFPERNMFLSGKVVPLLRPWNAPSIRPPNSNGETTSLKGSFQGSHTIRWSYWGHRSSWITSDERKNQKSHATQEPRVPERNMFLSGTLSEGVLLVLHGTSIDQN